MSIFSLMFEKRWKKDDFKLALDLKMIGRKIYVSFPQIRYQGELSRGTCDCYPTETTVWIYSLDFV